MTVTVVVLYLLGVVTHYHSYSERKCYAWEDNEGWDEWIDRAIPVLWPVFAVAVLCAMLWEKYKDMRG